MRAGPHGDITFITKDGEMAILSDDSSAKAAELFCVLAIVGSARFGHLGMNEFGHLGISGLLEVVVVVKLAFDGVTTTIRAGEEVVTGLAIFENLCLVACTTNEPVGPVGIAFEPALVAVAGIALANVSVTLATTPVSKIVVLVFQMAVITEVNVPGGTGVVRVRAAVNSLLTSRVGGDMFFTYKTLNGGLRIRRGQVVGFGGDDSN